MEVFRWSPQNGLDVTYDQKLKEVKFGDGYEQVAEDGLNSMRRLFDSVKFTDHEDGEVEAVHEFFIRHKFTKTFKLEIRGYSGLVKFAKPFKRKEVGGRIVELSFSLREVFQ